MRSPLRALWALPLWALAASALDSQWREGRATNYGGPGDGWSIHKGSCGYGYLDRGCNKGWDVAAISDTASDYSGSCGRCYEIRCDPRHLRDGYGAALDRTQACHDPSQSVVLTITDTCPCNYAPNYYSNKRWCCGDIFHLDVSTWAFERLAERKWGVIAMQYREVPCDHCPSNPAQLPPGAQPSPPVQDPPAGWDPSQDKRPYSKMCGGSGEQGGEDSQQQQQEQHGSGGSSSSSSSSGPAKLEDLVASGGQFGGWKDAGSYSLGSTWASKGPGGAGAWCGTLRGSGALRLRGSPGALAGGKRSLQLEAKGPGGGRLPDITVNLASSGKGACRGLDLGHAQAEWDGEWARLSLPLADASWSGAGKQGGFDGCSSSIGAWDVDQIELKNKWGGDQALCIANLRAG